MTRSLVLLALLLAGCQRADPPPTQPVEDRTHPYTPAARDVPVYVDPETGCQYLGYTGHGLTPRLVWDEKRQEMVTMGCRIVEYERGQ